MRTTIEQRRVAIEKALCELYEVSDIHDLHYCMIVAGNPELKKTNNPMEWNYTADKDEHASLSIAANLNVSVLVGVIPSYLDLLHVLRAFLYAFYCKWYEPPVPNTKPDPEVSFLFGVSKLLRQELEAKGVKTAKTDNPTIH